MRMHVCASVCRTVCTLECHLHNFEGLSAFVKKQWCKSIKSPDNLNQKRDGTIFKKVFDEPKRIFKRISSWFDGLFLHSKQKQQTASTQTVRDRSISYFPENQVCLYLNLLFHYTILINSSVNFYFLWTAWSLNMFTSFYFHTIGSW